MKKIREQIKRHYQCDRIEIRIEYVDGEPVAQIYRLNDRRMWRWCGSVNEFIQQYGLPLREGIAKLTYHRQPTPSELRFGEGAIHYADFDISECCWPGTRIAKDWLVSDFDGLRYYR